MPTPMPFWRVGNLAKVQRNLAPGSIFTACYLPPNRSRRVAEAVQQNRAWLQVEWLPDYAPELRVRSIPSGTTWTTPPSPTPRWKTSALATPGCAPDCITLTAGLQWVAASFVTPIFFDFILFSLPQIPIESLQSLGVKSQRISFPSYRWQAPKWRQP